MLIDGVKYELWTPKKEIEEFHPLVKEHYKEIFGQNSFFIEGSKLKSEAGKGSIPDGFVIALDEKSKWYIVEIELSTHELYDHIVNQVGRFINGIKKTETQKKVLEIVYHYIHDNKGRKAEFEDAIGSGEIYKYLSELINKPPILVIIIEKRTQELDEAIDLLRYALIEIVEFQTFVSEENISHHAHFFKPMNSGANSEITEREEILQKLRQELIRLRPNIRPQKPTGRYFKVSTGYSGIHFELLCWGEDYLGIELHLERAMFAENDKLFCELKYYKDALEKSLGEPLTFESPWHKHWARIYVLKKSSEIEQAALMMAGFTDVFLPIVKKLTVMT